MKLIYFIYHLMINKMRIGVVGSRNFKDYDLLKKELDYINTTQPITMIVSGGAPGADTLGERYAEENRIEKKIYKPNWFQYGPKAGIMRNTKIVKKSEMVIAFWDGQSKGMTKDFLLYKKLLPLPTRKIKLT